MSLMNSKTKEWTHHWVVQKQQLLAGIDAQLAGKKTADPFWMAWSMSGPTFAAEAKKQFTFEQVGSHYKLAAEIENMIDALDKAIKRVQLFQQAATAK